MRRAALPLALAVALAAPLAATGGDEYRNLQRLDARLHAVGWQLATGNARFCRETVPATGALLQDAAAYPDPAAARAALGLTGDIAIQAVVAGSPADLAGLRAGATLTAIEGEDPALRFPPSEPAWHRLKAVNDHLDRLLGQHAAVAVQWSGRDPGAAALSSTPACRSRFEVGPIGDRAVADGDRVLLGDGFVGFAWEEELFAAAVAHELAHNVLGHRAWLDGTGRSRANVRRTEREADRLTPWLLANASYDPAAGVAFMRKWGPDHGGGLFRKRTHDGWDERAEAIAAELPAIAAAIERDGAADWQRHFRRELTE